jgi:PhnB protein
MKFIAYLTFDGRCREALEFYAKVLDGKIIAMISHGETPAGEHVAANWQDKIINAHLIADGAELMGADSPPEQGDAKIGGFSVSIHVEEEERAERIFQALSDGGSVLMPIQPTFWAKKFGMVTDRYGTPWMVNCASEQQQ